MKARFLVTSIVMATALAGTAQAEPLRIGYFVWIGNGPLFVAQEKGLFASEGIEVELINFEDHAAIFVALSARQIDAAQGAFQDPALFSEPDEEPWRCVLVIDDSRGADGVMAVRDIETIAQLEGRTVAATQEGLPRFYLRLLLKEAGLSVDDVEIVDLSSEDAAQAAQAFLLQEVDAVVTYEPYLREAKQAPQGHLLTDSTQQPGLIFDCLMSQESIVEARLEAFRALARAWDAAVAYIDANPEQANAVMARSLGGWLQDPALFNDLVKGVRFYNLAANRAFFGTREQPGPIYDSMQLALDALAEAGQLKAELTPADVIGHHIVDE